MMRPPRTVVRSSPLAHHRSFPARRPFVARSLARSFAHRSPVRSPFVRHSAGAVPTPRLTEDHAMTRELTRRPTAVLALLVAALAITLPAATARAQQPAPPARGSGSAVEGTVRDVASGRPLANAQVMIAGTTIGAATTEAGTYRIANVARRPRRRGARAPHRLRGAEQDRRRDARPDGARRLRHAPVGAAARPGRRHRHRRRRRDEEARQHDRHHRHRASCARRRSRAPRRLLAARVAGRVGAAVVAARRAPARASASAATRRSRSRTTRSSTSTACAPTTAARAPAA